MRIKFTPEQFNGLYEIVSLGDSGPEQFKKKEFEGAVKVSGNGKALFRVPNVVIKDKETGRIDKTASVAVETASALASLASYGASGEGFVEIVTWVSNGREALSISLPGLTDHPAAITPEQVRDVLARVTRQGQGDK